MPLNEMKTDFLSLLICGLATFRLAILISIDTGPSKIFSRFRSFLKREAKEHPALRKSDVHHGVDCLRCSSIWVALPVALFAYFRESAPDWLRISGDTFLIWLSLSAMSILWHRAFPAR